MVDITRIESVHSKKQKKHKRATEHVMRLRWFHIFDAFCAELSMPPSVEFDESRGTRGSRVVSRNTNSGDSAQCGLQHRVAGCPANEI